MRKENDIGAHDGTNSSSSEAEDQEYENISTRNTSQVLTCGLHNVGSPSNIHMENNSDVHIGSRLHYNAPVTINQYVSVLGNSDVTQNSILHEAVKAPVHGLDTNEKISQGKFTKAQISFRLSVLDRLKTKEKEQTCLDCIWETLGSNLGLVTGYLTVVLCRFPQTLRTNFRNMDDRAFLNLSLLPFVVSPFQSVFCAVGTRIRGVKLPFSSTVKNGGAVPTLSFTYSRRTMMCGHLLAYFLHIFMHL
jgi:hypothetical protein